jgi:hypothetical protein
MLYRRCLPALAVALAMALTGCSHGSSSATRSTPSAAPVYPGARVGPWGNAYSTSDSFDTVYSYYEKNLPAGSERSHITGPQQTAIFLIGSGNDRLSVTVAASPLCCRTLIVIARARA